MSKTWFFDSLSQAGGFFVAVVGELAIIFVVVSLLVGLLHEFVPAARVRDALADRGTRGNIIGAGFGAVTPFCGCSTIPVLTGLLKAGVPFGAAMSYLLASPLLNPVVLALFWVAFGWRVTAIYAAIAFSLAVVAGRIWDAMGFARHLRTLGGCGSFADAGHLTDWASRARRLLAGAWQQLRTFLPYMVAGVAIGAVLYGFVPQDWLVRVAGADQPLAVPVSAAVGVPLYVRVSTMVPIGLALHEGGMALGAVMALIIAGAGASIPEITLLSRIFRPTLLIAFVVTVFAAAIGTGLLFNFLFT
jgi:uncharacterized membrane protein YraQ (UPF0718 family)